MSPTISSRMSSRVTIPMNSPYSSTTSASGVRRRRNALSCSDSGRMSGTNQGGRATAMMSTLPGSPPAAWIARNRSFTCRMPTMFSGDPRHSGIRVTNSSSTRSTTFSARLADIGGDHLGAVDHDVGHGEVAQVEQSAEHVAIELFDAAFPVQQVDRAAQAFMRRQQRLALAGPDAGERQHLAHQPFRTRSAPGRARRRRARSAAPPPARDGRAR